MKQIDKNKKVAELISENPEIKDIMISLGFKDITNPMALQTVGKIMTLEKGAQIKGIPWEKVQAAFAEHGFELASKETKTFSIDPSNDLESYILRLQQGEDLESVRADFVKAYENVSVQEIANAEQELINKGMPVPEVQRLCDVHSALFHGKTEAEVLADEQIPAGHPVSIMKLENQILKQYLDQNREIPYVELKKHYKKKEELILAQLDALGYPGPNQVMWGVDDEILHDIPNNRSRIEEMIFKENQILFPLALEKFSKEMWYQIYQDMPIYGNAFISEVASWPEAETYRRPGNDGFLHFENGDLTVAQFEAICKALPVELTFIDANDINRFFSITNGVFARPKTALNRKVYSCHPPRVQPIVKQMLSDFKSHKCNKVERWFKNTRIQYVAIYDQEDQYMGCLEIVQDFSEILKNHQ